eukprot:1877893-Amphidinium_carterae.1
MGLIVRWRLEPTPEGLLPLQPQMNKKRRSSAVEDASPAKLPPRETLSRDELPGSLVAEFLETEKNRCKNTANGGGDCSGVFDDYSLCKAPATASVTNGFIAMLREKVFKTNLSHMLPSSLLVDCRYGTVDLLKMLKSGYLDAACAGDPSGNCCVFEGTAASLREVFNTTEGKLLQVFTSHKYSERYSTESRVLDMVEAGDGNMISRALSPMSTYTQKIIADFPERKAAGGGASAI